ncbi:MAG: hypothetical protein FJW38_18810 [Acidobacteria bacterium]|nr:hypothetical protein [Acidobacteriota bacterium]
MIAVARVWACSCSGWPSAKGAWETSPVVFLGYVERAEYEFDRSTGPVNDLAIKMGPQTAWVIKVEEAFKGAKADAVFRLKQPGHSCAPKFEAGQKAVFYLHPAKPEGAWEAYGCDRTRAETSAADDLLFLRALPWAAQRARLSGTVELFENSSRPRQTQTASMRFMIFRLANIAWRRYSRKDWPFVSP